MKITTKATKRIGSMLIVAGVLVSAILIPFFNSSRVAAKCTHYDNSADSRNDGYVRKDWYESDITGETYYDSDDVSAQKACEDAETEYLKNDTEGCKYDKDKGGWVFPGSDSIFTVKDECHAAYNEYIKSLVELEDVPGLNEYYTEEDNEFFTACYNSVDLAWVVCPILNGLSKLMDGLMEAIESFF